MLELWDSDSRNVIRFFESAAEADDVVSAHVRDRGLAVLEGLALLQEDAREQTELIAEGQAIPAALKRLRTGEASVSVPAAPGRRIAG